MTLNQFIDSVEKLAFEMPAPNQYTPRFVQLCNDFRASLNSLPSDPEWQKAFEPLIKPSR